VLKHRYVPLIEFSYLAFRCGPSRITLILQYEVGLSLILSRVLQ